VIPVRNGGDFVADAIKSVYDQTALPGEVIVVDDGSTDETLAVLQEFAAWPGFRSVRTAHIGPGPARNTGVSRAHGAYIAFLDHDDIWRPEKLERQLEEFRPTWGMSFTAYERSSQLGSELVRLDTWSSDPRAVLTLLVADNRIAPSTVLIRRETLETAGRFDEGVFAGEDWLAWLRVAAAGNEIGYLPEPLTVYRWHGHNRSNVDSRTYYERACHVFDRFGDDQLRAWWRLKAAVYARECQDRRLARRLILEAACIRPRSIRPGWVKLL
jgi:glycosyltransferase involved in cell wall biosynthesis